MTQSIRYLVQTSALAETGRPTEAVAVTVLRKAVDLAREQFDVLTIGHDNQGFASTRRKLNGTTYGIAGPIGLEPWQGPSDPRWPQSLRYLPRIQHHAEAQGEFRASIR